MSHTPLRRTAIACGLALVIGLTAAPDAHADQIDGTLHFTGTGMLDSSIPTSTQFTSFSNVKVQTGTTSGDYAGTDGISVEMTPFTFWPDLSPVPVVPLWAFEHNDKTYAFDLHELTSVMRLSIGTFQLLSLKGNGSARIDGFDPTPGTWALSTQGGNATLSFSAQTTAEPAPTVPEGGNTMLMLVIGCSVTGFLNRRRFVFQSDK